MLVIDVEHERPDLDTLSRFLVHVPLVYETAVGRPTGASSAFVAVKAPEHKYLLGRLLVQVAPPVFRARLHGEGLAHAVREYQLVGQQVGVRAGGGIDNAEGILAYGADGSPGVDDFEAAGEKMRG